MEWVLIYYLAGQPVFQEVVNEAQCKLFSTRMADGRYMLSLRLDDEKIVQPERIECVAQTLMN